MSSLEQYQQALAAFKAANVPLNSLVQQSSNQCCVREGPIPNVSTSFAISNPTGEYVELNSQSGNSVGTFFAYGCGNLTNQGTSCVEPALGYTAADNSEYISLRVKRQYTNSRLRFISDPTPWTGNTDTFVNFNQYNTARFTARAKIEYFNFDIWNLNVALLGFYSGTHAGDLTAYKVETGLVFRPNQYGNWRCSWFTMLDNNIDYNTAEVFFFDTEVSVEEVHDLKIIVEDYNKKCTWYIDDVEICNVDINHQIPDSDDGGPVTQFVVSNLLFSWIRPTNLRNCARAGCEVRQRTPNGLTESSQDFRINLYNSNFSVIP